MMRGKMIAISRLITGAMVAGLLANIAFPVHAAEPPFPNKRISLVPNQQPIGDTIRDLFTQAGMTVNVSTKFQERASARWTGTPAEIWKQISKAFNAVAYYDGAVVRVYHASEIKTRTINAADPKSVEQQAARMGLIGPGNNVKAGKNTVTATGVPAFLESIGQLASRTSAPVVASAPPITPIRPSVAPPSNVPMASDIVSPMNRGAVASSPPPAQQAAANNAALPYKLQYTVMSQATRQDPYEIRMYNLQYAEANDKTVNVGDGSILFRGVASVLRDQAGLGMSDGTAVTEQGGPSGARRIDDQYAPLPPGMPYYPQPATGQQAQPELAPALANGPRITVYSAGNAVIVRDLASRMGVYNALVRQLDVPRAQINVVATIIDIDTSRTKELGVDWNFGFSALGGLFEGSIASPNGPTNGNFQGNFVKSNSKFVSAKITALSRNGTFRVVKNTNISMKENEPGVSDAREVIPIKSSGGQYQGGTLTDYRIGIFMAITPKVSKEADGLTTHMDIDIRDGSISGYLPDGTPTFKNNVLTSNLSVRQGESLIIGGFTSESSYDYKSKIPGLGDVPLAGNLFKKRNKGQTYTERVLILTPTVMSNEPSALASNNAVEEEDEEESEELANRKRSGKKTKKTKAKRTAS